MHLLCVIHIKPTYNTQNENSIPNVLCSYLIQPFFATEASARNYRGSHKRDIFGVQNIFSSACTATVKLGIFEAFVVSMQLHCFSACNHHLYHIHKPFV